MVLKYYSLKINYYLVLIKVVNFQRVLVSQPHSRLTFKNRTLHGKKWRYFYLLGFQKYKWQALSSWKKKKINMSRSFPHTRSIFMHYPYLEPQSQKFNTKLNQNLFRSVYFIIHWQQDIREQLEIKKNKTCLISK